MKELTISTKPPHPCFNKGAAGSCGRVHLPVAPKCNISCNYCNRKYDCVNESRPGVTSAVLTPAQAEAYMDKVMDAGVKITVAGIAGPGDPFANAAQTLHTMRLVKAKHPDLILCLSTNGFGVLPHLEELKEIGVSHLTITVNAATPATAAKIYGWVREGKVVYKGEAGAEKLMARQYEALKKAKELGLTVKVNTIVIPGVNDHEIEDIARKIRNIGVDLMNLIPLIPTEGTRFADLEEPDKATIKKLRAVAEQYVPQMTHCKRCRADAVGLLDNDKSAELGPALRQCAAMTPPPEAARPFVAVASREGMLINKHLGEATTFYIFGQNDHGFYLAEERQAPRPGAGPSRWKTLAQSLSDCRAVLCQAYGETPAKILSEAGITPHACSGPVDPALELIYSTGDVSVLTGRKGGVANACCGGGGGGGGC